MMREALGMNAVGNLVRRRLAVADMAGVADRNVCPTSGRYGRCSQLQMMAVADSADFSFLRFSPFSPLFHFFAAMT
jgi:hypothetical protein